MTEAQIKAEVDRLGAISPWYHDIRLSPNVTTGGWAGIHHVWGLIRTVRFAIEEKYRGATVLDLASWDGGWAFEAEDLGAKTVVAFELGIVNRLEHFLFCRGIRNSKVIPMYGADAERADEFLASFVSEYGKFDVIQHMGLLYHLKNPMRSLEAARRIIKPDGVLLLETAGAIDRRPVMLSNHESSIYEDRWTYWAPTESALRYMLLESGFQVREGFVGMAGGEKPRIALLADPI